MVQVPFVLKDREDYDGFNQQLLQFFAHNKRDLPWRHLEQGNHIDPYKVLVSEIMLQQTQVERVVPKYVAWLKKFPTMQALATAEFQEVLSEWFGLGYNRRAKNIYTIARMLADSDFPRSVSALEQLDGIGKNTAGAILVYTFDQKELFIETNVRTVLLHHFFSANDPVKVPDKELQQLLEALLAKYKGSWRVYFWALMDYGSTLKKQGHVEHRRSTTYRRQTKVQGSSRELRSRILKLLITPSSREELHKKLNDPRVAGLVKKLEDEGFIELSSDGDLKIARL